MSTVSINDVSQGRGLSGTRPMVFAVTLDVPSDKPVTVTATTQKFPQPNPLDAEPGADYDTKSEQITFQPGETSKPFEVTLHGTSQHVPDKLFEVVLSDASVPILRRIGTGILKYQAPGVA